MSDSMPGLQRRIATAADLQSVVRTMRAMAASSIAQYEQSVLALERYQEAVDAGLGACLRQGLPFPGLLAERGVAPVGRALVIGSDQGLVGPFNDTIAGHVASAVATWPRLPRIWAVGERVRAQLEARGLVPDGMYELPHAVTDIGALVDRLLLDLDAVGAFTVFHNRPLPGARYEPVSRRLLPLDAAWSARLEKVRWAGVAGPEIMGEGVAALRMLIREHLFISLFRACAESLASENASRLAAMERAERSIEEQLALLHGTFHRLRQNAIDAELFDLLAASGLQDGECR